MNRFVVISASLVLFVSILVLLPLNPKSSYWLKWRASLIPSTKLASDLIVRNGITFTNDSSLSFADSMAIRDGRIHRVGNYSSLQDLAGYGTKELNLEGKVVVPGFIDSHVNLLFGGLQMMRVELRGVNQKEKLVRRVKEATSDAKSGSWILGGGWNNDFWGGELLAASWIDEGERENERKKKEKKSV